MRIHNRTVYDGKNCDAERPPTASASPPAKEVQEGCLLRSLRLTADDLEALRRQGSVHLEHRGRRILGKLRFRRDGRQIVRYLGGEEAARQVQQELARWQAPYRKSRRLAGLARAARAALRASRQAVAPYLERNGYRFHGLAWRRPRSASRKGTDPEARGRTCRN